MDRFIVARGSATPPAPPASGTANYPKSGNPAGEMPSIMGPYWYHMITESLRNVVVGGGKTPNHADHTLLLQAIQALIEAGIPTLADASPTTKGIVQLADGPTAQGLTDATKALTAATLSAILGAGSLTAGYAAFPFRDVDGGLQYLIVQTGVVSVTSAGTGTTGEASIIWPIEFPTALMSLAISHEQPLGAIDANIVAYHREPTKNGCIIGLDGNVAPTSTWNVRWIAIGK